MFNINAAADEAGAAVGYDAVRDGRAGTVDAHGPAEIGVAIGQNEAVERRGGANAENALPLPVDRNIRRAIAVDVALDGDSVRDKQFALGLAQHQRAAGEIRREGDGVGAGSFIGERQRLAQRSQAVIGINNIVQRGDDDLVRDFERAEVRDAGAVVGHAREIAAGEAAGIRRWNAGQGIVAGIDGGIGCRSRQRDGLDRPAIVGEHAGQHRRVCVVADRGEYPLKTIELAPLICRGGAPDADANPTGADPMRLPP